MPGGIDLTVENAAETDEGYDVLVDSKAKKTAIPNRTCVVVDIAPGLHELSCEQRSAASRLMPRERSLSHQTLSAKCSSSLPSGKPPIRTRKLGRGLTGSWILRAFERAPEHLG